MRSGWRHWSVWAVVLIAAVTLWCVFGFLHRGRQQHRLITAVEQAGGFVEIQAPAKLPYIHSLPVRFGRMERVAFSMGSHPIPEELRLVRKFPAITALTLGTHQCSDEIVPLISSLEGIEALDLRGSGFSLNGIRRLLASLPKLKRLIVDGRLISSGEASDLRRDFPAEIVFQPVSGSFPSP